MHFQLLLFNTALLTLVGILTQEFSLALRDVSVKVPHAVRRGEHVTLKCYYDIEDDSLYSIKWYKGRREFYRYTPKENPAMKIFQFPGVKVERYSSNESQLVLGGVTMATSGKYSCEVSADAPSFHTLIAAGELEVIEPPHNAPIITGIRPRYHIGDILRGNCTARHSKPAANLTWTVHNEELPTPYVRAHRILHDKRNDFETSVLGIHFVLTEQHFENGKLKLRCTAQLYDVYQKSTERIALDADYHRKHSAASSGVDINGNSVPLRPPYEEPYDQYALHDGELLRKKDNYLTRLQDFFLHFMPSSRDEGDPADQEYTWGASNSAHVPHTTRSAELLSLALLLCCMSKQLLVSLASAWHQCSKAAQQQLQQQQLVSHKNSWPYMPMDASQPKQVSKQQRQSYAKEQHRPPSHSCRIRQLGLQT